ncbi:hypothetical protein SISSUDRAFT_994402 [Sistotremastrum suecicum HHB10207 ss-3]|uniref:Alpha/beta hydrolase n=1 Tax=Sistotremastrum suecicum HHB10207 ss-3 TaxID=1314776 RepID=A0A165XDN9_9AGAM|nr:hypothetical protein SISSUDRAFT_994402 [Sistotremastrum suecicum HHB10207 ss-3]
MWLRQYRVLIGGSRVATKRYASSHIKRHPSTSAVREVPTPLVFLSARSWDPNSDMGMRHLASWFPERGYTTIEIDVDVESLNDDSTMWGSYEPIYPELGSQIRLADAPWPPVLFARSAGSLIAQTYISSNPSTGLCLISPPFSNADVQNVRMTTRVDYTFEPKFPIAILDETERLAKLQAHHRLLQFNSPWVSALPVNTLGGQEMVNILERWLDDIGV